MGWTERKFDECELDDFRKVILVKDLGIDTVWLRQEIRDTKSKQLSLQIASKVYKSPWLEIVKAGDPKEEGFRVIMEADQEMSHLHDSESCYEAPPPVVLEVLGSFIQISGIAQVVIRAIEGKVPECVLVKVPRDKMHAKNPKEILILRGLAYDFEV